MNIFVKQQVVGGHGGNVFHWYGGKNGKFLEKIGVWAGPNSLTAVKIWLTDLSPQVYGHPNGQYTEFSFQPGERMTELSLWGDGQGTRCGAIHFKTSSGREFKNQMTARGQQQEYPIDVGSGICAGVVGRSGHELDRLGFVFLKPISFTKLTNMHYPTLKMDAQSIQPETLEAFADSNPANADNPTTYSFSGSEKKTLSRTWTVSVGLELSQDYTVEGKVPEIADAKVKTAWKLSVSGTFSTTNSEERTLAWAESGTLQPGDSVSMDALTRKGTLSIPFDGEMFVKLKNGLTFSYPVSGIYSGVDYTDVEISHNS